jgi:hypothetical protein
LWAGSAKGGSGLSESLRHKMASRDGFCEADAVGCQQIIRALARDAQASIARGGAERQDNFQLTGRISDAVLGS